MSDWSPEEEEALRRAGVDPSGISKSQASLLLKAAGIFPAEDPKAATGAVSAQPSSEPSLQTPTDAATTPPAPSADPSLLGSPEEAAHSPLLLPPPDDAEVSFRTQCPVCGHLYDAHIPL